MKHFWFIGALVVLALAAAFFWRETLDRSSSLRESVLPERAATTHADISVEAPAANQKITSPLLIRGRARGTWYFEASFPARLLDGQSREIAVMPLQAQGEWMTTDFVPFEGTMTFPKPVTAEGTLVFEKDNPSGLPEHAAEIRIPVRFAP